MAIKVFSDEERAAAKAKATAEFQGACVDVHLEWPIEESLILAPFDRQSYHAYSDKEDADPQSAYSTALMGRLLFPDFVALNEMNGRWPALAERAAAALAREAGNYTGCHPVKRLDLKALPAGLSEDAAKKIIADANGRNVWQSDLKDGSASFVLVTPDPHKWIAARAACDSANRAGKTKGDAIDPYVQQAIAWSTSPLVGGAGILDMRPALIWYLWEAYKKAGGEGAATRTFRF